jgi:hypothetical protein
MTREEAILMSEKISLALELSFKRLMEKIKKEIGELFFSKYGKVVRVKALDLK